MAVITEAEILELVKDQIMEYANKVVDEFHSISQETIQYFYGDYVPFYYSRADSLYGTVTKIYPRWTGKGAVCGLHISSGGVVTNHDSSDYVFTGAMEMGVHGTSLIATTAPSPMETIMNYYNSL